MRNIVLAVALALFASGLVGAASLSEFRIKAPQPFTVGGTAMPAGVYDIGLVSPAGVLEITNIATHNTGMVIGSPISSAPGTQLGQVTFTPVDGELTLAQAHLPSGTSFGVPTHSAKR